MVVKHITMMNNLKGIIIITMTLIIGSKRVIAESELYLNIAYTRILIFLTLFLLIPRC